MPTELYKEPKRDEKYYKGRALIYARQYGHRQKNSILHQNAVFYKFGSEMNLIYTFAALSQTVDDFNRQYKDTVTNRHGMLLISIRHYVAATFSQSFTEKDILAYFPNLKEVLGTFVRDTRSFKMLFNDLEHYQFVNPLGKKYAKAYMPTTRLRLLCNMFEENCKKFFK